MPIVTIQFFGFLRVRVGQGVAFTDVFSSTAARTRTSALFIKSCCPAVNQWLAGCSLQGWSWRVRMDRQPNALPN